MQEYNVFFFLLIYYLVEPHVEYKNGNDWNRSNIMVYEWNLVNLQNVSLKMIAIC